MSKLEYIIKASQNELTESSALVLMHIARNNLITLEELQSTFGSVDEVAFLRLLDMIHQSVDAFVVTTKAMDILQVAADTYAEENNPNLLKKRNARKARDVSEEMEEAKDHALLVLDTVESLTLKDVTLYRSNYILMLDKRTFGIRSFEVNNNCTLRIFGYKMKPEIVKHFTNLGMTSRVAANGNIYLDIPRTNENITMIISSINSL